MEEKYSVVCKLLHEKDERAPKRKILLHQWKTILDRSGKGQ